MERTVKYGRDSCRLRFGGGHDRPSVFKILAGPISRIFIKSFKGSNLRYSQEGGGVFVWGVGENGRLGTGIVTQGKDKENFGIFKGFCKKFKEFSWFNF